ncbi:hypothetical protein [Chryseobacterium sp. SIMBA_038]|uniref:hypothetical protein n=1 Tax=Chryseobacterium sp. SIMBA_038 TaxID=3085780 RepID=UPI0039797D79
MNSTTIYILAGIVFLLMNQSCRSGDFLEINDAQNHVNQKNSLTASAKSDSTVQKEIEVIETDPPKDRDNWKIAN